MKILDLVNYIDAGNKPTVEFIKDAETDFEGHNTGMRANIISVKKSEYFKDDGSYLFLFDLKPFVEYNKKFAKVEWYDENGEETKTWFEVEEYPENGIYEQYLRPEYEDDVLKLAEENPVYDYYLKLVNDGMKQEYLPWLETTIKGLLRL